MDTSDGPMEMTGTVATVPADNLGSHAVGGFKEGGSALRPCRHCWGSSTEIKEKVLLLLPSHNFINRVFFFGGGGLFLD